MKIYPLKKIECSFKWCVVWIKAQEPFEESVAEPWKQDVGWVPSNARQMTCVTWMCGQEPARATVRVGYRGWEGSVLPQGLLLPGNVAIALKHGAVSWLQCVKPNSSEHPHTVLPTLACGPHTGECWLGPGTLLVSSGKEKKSDLLGFAVALNFPS